MLGIYAYKADGQRIRKWQVQLDLGGTPIAAPLIGRERFYWEGRIAHEQNLDAAPGDVVDIYAWVG